MTKPIDSHTAELRRLADAYERCEATLAALVREVQAIRLHQVGQEYRDELIAGLGAAIGLGPTETAAKQIALVLAGAADPPAGTEDLVALLRTSSRKAPPSSSKQIKRVLQAAAEAKAADKLAPLCLFRFQVDDDSTSTTETDTP